MAHRNGRQDFLASRDYSAIRLRHSVRAQSGLIVSSQLRKYDAPFTSRMQPVAYSMPSTASRTTASAISSGVATRLSELCQV